MKTSHSIIIPTSGRPLSIKAVVQSLLAVTASLYDTEIIIVDNNLVQHLSDNIADYCKTLHGVRYIRECSPGLTAARHRGYAAARGTVLTFIDDDVEVSDTWLSAIRRGFDDPEVALIGGPSIPKFTCSIPGWFWDHLKPTPYGGWMCVWLSLLDIGKSIKHINPNYVWGLNFSIRRDVFEKCDGFHPDSVPEGLQRWQGDGETGLTMKVAAAGFRSDYLQEALLFHRCDADRLSAQYLVTRAYFQGICDSFTQIRAGQDAVPNSFPYAHRSIYHKWRSTAKAVLRRILASWPRGCNERAIIRMMAEDACIAGWHFHQSEVAADPKLLAWVRRPNYLDINVPEELTFS
jgi:glycosyltransferase involved in cell wall biosynthesis